MPISGTVPSFDLSTAAEQPPVLVTVTGLVADGQATGPASSETLQAFYRRACNSLAISGVLSGAGFQAVTDAALSGVMQMQREFAFRAADIEKYTHDNAERLVHAQAILAVSGEVQFGA